MAWKILIIAIAWLIFFCFWVAASFIYKTAQRKTRDKNWFLFLISTILITLAAEYLTADYLLKSFELPSPLNYLTNTIGIILLLSGLCLAIWARITLGSFWSGSVAFIENQSIVRKGPYSIVRHPIYAGVISMLWGGFLLERIGMLLLAAILGTILLICKAKLEEALLERHKGAEYTVYKNKVKRTV